AKSGPDLLPHVHVVAANGGEDKRLTDADTYSDSSPVWTPDGKAIIYLSGTDAANIGQAGRSTAQIYIVALTRQDKEPGATDVDSEEDAAKLERPRSGGRPRGEGAADERAPVVTDVKIDFDGITRRGRQLTRSG